MRHLEEQQVRQLLDVVAVGKAIVADDVAVVPEFGDDLLRVHVFTRAVTICSAALADQLFRTRQAKGAAEQSLCPMSTRPRRALSP